MEGELRLRDAGDEDYPAIARIRNRNNPANPHSAEELRHFDRAFSGPPLFRRTVMAEQPGAAEPVGYGVLNQLAHNFHPRKYWVHVSVDPAYQGRGIGSRLFERLLAEARQRNALLLWTDVLADHPAGLRFFEHRGFVERGRFRRSRLIVAHAKLDSLPDRTGELTAAGIRFSTLAELGPDRAVVRQRYFRLHRATSRDIPTMGEQSDLEFEQFLEAEIEGPGALPQATFLAVAGETYVGVTTLERNETHPEELHVGYTGTDPEYRGRGIATELKRRAIRYAQDGGYREITAGNDFQNSAIWAINERLGFRTVQVYINGERPLAER